MLVELDLPFADVRAGDLVLTLGCGPRDALEVRAARLGGFEVELRLLGCSHQALVAGSVSETVACTPGVPGRLPDRHDELTALGEHYAFRAEVLRLDATGYVREATAAIAAARDDALGLVGLFPAPAPLGPAFTALRLSGTDAGVAWQTWHGYPQTGEVVVTRTELSR